MRFSFYLFSLFLIISCTVRTNSEKENIKRDSILAFLKEYTDILGRWSLCAESIGGQMIQYNQCSDVVFDSDGNGSKINPGGGRESFRWSLKQTSLKLSYDDDDIDTNTTFTDTSYVVIMSPNSNNLQMEIRQERGDHSIYLSRKPY